MAKPLAPLYGLFVSQMPDDMRAAIDGAGTLVHYEPGTTLQQRGDWKKGLSIIVEGAVEMSATDSEGTRTIYVVLRPGHCFGEMSLFLETPRLLDATVIGETVIREISRDAFSRLLEVQPDLRDHLIAGLARQLGMALQLLDDQRRLPATVRLARILVAVARPDDDQFAVRASQARLAEALAVSRVTVGQALATLKAEGLVDTGYGAVVIPDMANMHRWIGEHTPMPPLSDLF